MVRMGWGGQSREERAKPRMAAVSGSGEEIHQMLLWGGSMPKKIRQLPSLLWQEREFRYGGIFRGPAWNYSATGFPCGFGAPGPAGGRL